MRRTSRENAFKLIFEKSVSGGTGEITYAVLTRMMNSEENGYFNYLIDGIEKNKQFLMDAVKNYSRGFDIDRIYKVDLAILMVSSYEILFSTDVPDKVAVNEALELSKIYSTDNSPSFINGILASIIREKSVLLDNYSKMRNSENDGSSECAAPGDDISDDTCDLFAEIKESENESKIN